MHYCKGIGCANLTLPTQDFCPTCIQEQVDDTQGDSSLSSKYPSYYKSVEHLNEIDVYAIHQLFQVEDCSGALQHASRKLLLSGTDDQTKFQNIKEARDTLTRWLELNSETIH